MKSTTDDDLIDPFTRPIFLKNKNCLYCGIHFSDEIPSNQEHVIGRRFVPKKTLENQGNLIANTCLHCNNAKSDLEDDISAISMHPNVTGRFGSDNPLLAASAINKSQKAISRRTKKAVKDSTETLEIPLSLSSGIDIKVGMIAGPQIEPKRIYLLAKYHIQAFFYFLTMDSEKQIGYGFPGAFAPLTYAQRTDWGNSLFKSFMNLINSWDHRINLVTAQECFKIKIRRHPQGKDVWAWALEWNHNFRIIGFFGDEAEILADAGTLEKLKVHNFDLGPNRSLRVRTEIPLAGEEDTLFDFPVCG